MNRSAALGPIAGVAIAASLVLAGCQQTGPASALDLTTDKPPTAVVVAIAKTAQKCWFRSKDRVFGGYRLAAEVNSYAGRPRFLLVPKDNPGGLPVLVVEAEKTGGSAALRSYGPLLASSNGKRVAGDIRRWAGGDPRCQA